MPSARLEPHDSTWIQRMRRLLRRDVRRDPDDHGHELTCAEVAEMLQTFLDGELDVDMARRIDHHLDDCRRCGLEAETFEALRSAIRRCGQIDPALLARLERFATRLAAGDPTITAQLDHPDAPGDGRW